MQNRHEEADQLWRKIKEENPNLPDAHVKSIVLNLLKKDYSGRRGNSKFKLLSLKKPKITKNPIKKLVKNNLKEKHTNARSRPAEKKKARKSSSVWTVSGGAVSPR